MIDQLPLLSFQTNNANISIVKHDDPVGHMEIMAHQFYAVLIPGKYLIGRHMVFTPFYSFLYALGSYNEIVNTNVKQYYGIARLLHGLQPLKSFGFMQIVLKSK